MGSDGKPIKLREIEKCFEDDENDDDVLDDDFGDEEPPMPSFLGENISEEK